MSETPRKIYIIGPAGSGKSTLASQLGKKYNLPVLYLDNIFWRIKYTQENTFHQKQILLKEFMANTQTSGWIIEGTNQDFINQTISQNPKVFWLNPNIFILFYNVLKRFIKNKYLASNKKPDAQHTWYGLYWLFKGIINYKLHNNLYNTHKQTSFENKNN